MARPESVVRPQDLGIGRLFESVRDAVIVAEASTGRVVLWNPAATEIFGYSPSEALGGLNVEVLVPEYLRERHRAGLSRYRDTGHGPYIDSYAVLHLPAVRKSGEEIRVELTLSPLGSRPEAKAEGRFVLAIVRDVTERKEAEEEKARRARHAALRAEVSAALAEGDTLQSILQRCAERMVRHLDAAFARIWTVNEEENVLELRASAGMYTHLDGPHGRVPVGEYKIGLIAEEGRPHLTNDVTKDPRISDKEWAQREGMKAFAGYPLIVEDGVVGVAAIFARQPLKEDAIEALASVADALAQGIEVMRAEEEIRKLNAELEGRVAERTTELSAAVSRLRSSERTLRESEERFRSAFEYAAIGMALVSLEGRWLEVNDPVCKLLGYSRKELLRTNFQKLTHPDDLEVDLEHLRGLLWGETRSYQVEKRYIHKEGHVVWGLLSASLVRDAEGAPLYVLAQIQDISQSKQQKEELERLNLQNESILRSAGEGIFGLDRKRRVTLVNPSGARMLGYEPEELAHRDMHSVTHHAKPDGTPCPDEECPIYAAFEDGSVHRRSDEMFWRKDGTSFPVEYTSTPIEVDGEVVGAVVTFSDITDRKRAEEALTQALRAKTEFLAEVSHELRTPLTVIRGNAEVGLHIERGCAHEELLEEIVKEAAAMSRMVEDLLFLARSDSDSFPLDLETIPVSQILVGLGRRAEALAREHGASLKTALSSEGTLRCDPERIEQAVLVLVDNAVKYGPPGGEVPLSSSTHRDELLLEVADRGPGIPPEELSRIFERFYRCENASEEPGSGLGLPIAEAIVKRHGGRIEAESSLGEGTRMSLHLPLASG
jgi:PAS domain S-box-containing protein